MFREGQNFDREKAEAEIAFSVNPDKAKDIKEPNRILSEKGASLSERIKAEFEVETSRPESEKEKEKFYQDAATIMAVESANKKRE